MVNGLTVSTRLNKGFLLFIVIHLIVWTLSPALLRYNLPMDAIEGTLWGHQFQWGYDKNPFLSGVLTGLIVRFSHHSDWVIYFFSQLCVVICFGSILNLGKKLLTPLDALVSVIMLEGIQYYNLHAIDFSDNTLELSLWGLTTLFFYTALTKNQWRTWFFTGLFAGLAMMTKYYSALLLFSMALLLLQKNKWRNPKIIAALISFFIVITPHFIWLCHHHFITIHYMLMRTASTPAGYNHFYFPMKFILEQCEAFLPAFILFTFLLIGRKKNTLIQTRQTLNSFDHSFLIWMGLGPFLLTLFISALSGMTLRAGWGTPLLSWSGLLLIAWLQPDISLAKLYRFLIAVSIFIIVISSGYTAALLKSKTTSSANFPGKAIATALTDEWHARYHTRLHFVGGTRFIAGNIAYYSKDDPTVFLNWDKAASPWIHQKKLKHDGGIFVWDTAAKENISYEDIKKKYPRLSAYKTLQFSWRRNKHLTPIYLHVVFVPPESL